MSVEILSPTLARVTLDYQEVHRCSVGLLEFLQDKETNVGLAIGAMAMSIARLMGSDDMEPEEEAEFVQAMLEWAGSYFSEGGMN